MEEHILTANSPGVISEVIDGEAVIMNLTTGRYFSCQQVGGEIWALIEKGATRAEITDHVLGTYAVEPEVFAGSLEDFLSDLAEHDLVRQEPRKVNTEDQESVDSRSQAGNAPGKKAPYSPPSLNVYSDMEDLLLLDPIHDVDDTGWPQPKPESEG